MYKSHKIIYIVLILFLFSSFSSRSQSKFPNDYFRSPLDIPLLLSGNFGELRSTHFHSGIDIKTQGCTGQKVYSVADGYVSRIKVSAGGYGNAIYITHPNGYTSVYGHLQSFNKTIQSHVTNMQYKKQSFSANLFPPKDKFQLKKGDIIGLSGNSGSSAGPHLHFEIRETKTESPVNPLLFGFNIEDTIPPRVFNIAIYPKDSNSYIDGKNKIYIQKATKTNGIFGITGEEPVNVCGEIAFGIEANDYLNGSYNKCGLYTTKLYFDSVLIFYSKLKNLSFAEQRYIMSYYDYAYKVDTKKYIQKSFLDPNNKTHVVKDNINNGIVSISDTNIHTVNYVLTDVYNNISKISFNIKGSKAPVVTDNSITEYSKAMPYQIENSFEADGIKISIPKDALFDKLFFTYQLLNDSIPQLYSKLHRVHKPGTPLYKSYKLSIKTIDLPENLQDKAVIAIVSENKKSPVFYSAGGKWDNGYITTKVREFGDFAVVVDTIAPTIKPVNISNGKNMTKNSSIRIKIKDELSGIAKYEGFIDDKWVLFRYDAKNDIIEHRFSDKAIAKGNNHILKLRVVDRRNNEQNIELQFYK